MPLRENSQMPSEPQFPSGYIPYESVTLCGNTLRAVSVIFQVGESKPFWVGKGPGNHPQIWLLALLSNGKWIEVVRANIAVRPSVYPGANITVIQDAASPRTVVLAGTVILVDAIASGDGNSVEVPSIDLRPLGLNIFGKINEGLSFGGTTFASNNFLQVGTAFFASMSLVSSSERQDAYREMSAAGFDPSDFQISERLDRPTTIAYAITGKAIVTRVSSGDTRTYDAGHGTAWVVDLSRDLRAGAYGQPPSRRP